MPAADGAVDVTDSANGGASGAEGSRNGAFRGSGGAEHALGGAMRGATGSGRATCGAFPSLDGANRAMRDAMTNLFGTLVSSLVAARGASGAFSRSFFVDGRTGGGSSAAIRSSLRSRSSFCSEKRAARSA